MQLSEFIALYRVWLWLCVLHFRANLILGQINTWFKQTRQILSFWRRIGHFPETMVIEINKSTKSSQASICGKQCVIIRRLDYCHYLSNLRVHFPWGILESRPVTSYDYAALLKSCSIRITKSRSQLLNISQFLVLAIVTGTDTGLEFLIECPLF